MKTTIMINPCRLLKNERTSGGWTKSITSLDETKTSGHSLVGEFTRNNASDNYLIGGLYVDCDITSKKRNKYYTLFTVSSDGSVEKLGMSIDGPDWAIDLWPAIKEFFNEAKTINPFDGFSDEEILAEAKKRGLISGIYI